MPCLASTACAVHRPNGTSVRKVPSRSRPAPLHNQEIAFGRVRFVCRVFSHRAFRFGVDAPRGWHVCGLRFSAPLRSRPARLVRLGLRNPSAATGRLAWSEYLPAPPTAVSAASCASSRPRALPFASASPRPLPAIGTCQLIRRKRSRLRLPMSHTRAKRTDGASKVRTAHLEPKRVGRDARRCVERDARNAAWHFGA